MSRYISDHWYQVMKIILESKVHAWFSAEQGWCYLTSNGQRVKITPKITLKEVSEVVSIMKSARHLKFDEEKQLIKREVVQVGRSGGGVFRYGKV